MSSDPQDFYFIQFVKDWWLSETSRPTSAAVISTVELVNKAILQKYSKPELNIGRAWITGYIFWMKLNMCWYLPGLITCALALSDHYSGEVESLYLILDYCSIRSIGVFMLKCKY